MAYQLTKKQVLREIVKCGKDADYFINNYAKISHPIDGLIPFKTYGYQTDLLETFDDYRFVVVLKARQLGISTIVAAYVVWMMIFHRDKNILVMATKYNTAANLVKKVKSVIKSLPEWIRIANISVDNRNSFELDNGSQIKASSTSIDAGRSEALSLLVIDEAAHVEGLEELWTGLYPTISTGGKCIALSTPRGVGNWFHKTYTEAESQLNDFKPIRLDWHVHPDRDQEWFERETRNMSSRQIAQELNCNFNTSGETVLQPEDLDRINANLREPKHRTAFDRNLWIWEEYQQGCEYLLAADVARGDGEDYSSFHIIRLDTMMQVAEYQGKVTPDLFSNLLTQAGKEFGNCMMVVENNTVGFAVIDKLIETGYPNVYYSAKSTHEYIEPVVGEHSNNAVAGFSMTRNTRPLVFAKMEEFVRNDIVQINSARLFNELKTFIWTNGKPQAMRGYNDDLTVAFAIACWIRDTAINVGHRNVQYKKAFLNFGGMMKSDLVLDTNIPGMNNYRANEDNENIRKQKKIVTEYSWLYKG